ncbi:MAG: acyltransferase family protein [Bradyrhizobium sp.]|uniref:acyltransferase family protein n=1 Tax=Bradyrhizobium sp. TaxID=376 RepID=UPI003C7ABF63
MQLQFRADIDYLRAIAVVSVIGFHYGIPGFGGGFIGVDIFFVISGYLISRLIWSGLHADSFSFWQFYDRRARRLLPALYVMIAITGVAAWFLAPPADYRTFFGSAVATLLFSSNIFFWFNSSYFELPTIGKVLIHTWSLSVEEQFYFFFPLATWLWSKRFRDPTSRMSIALLLAGTVALCAADELLIKNWAEAAFYLSPLRAWEFLIGGLTLFAQRWSPSGFGARCTCAVVGGALMLMPIVAFTAEVRFPGLHALVPCLGAALFIVAFNRESGRPVPLPARDIGLFLGKMSYSLYLWHWPIFLLGNAAMPLAWVGSPLSVAALLAGSLLLGYLSYRFVETPPRKTVRWAGLRVSGLVATAAALLVVICAGGFAAQGFPTRYAQAEQRMLRYTIANMGPLYREHTCFLEPQESFASYDISACLTPVAGRINILLMGDSTAAHLSPALRKYLDPQRYNLLQLNSGACAPFIGIKQAFSKNCDEINATFASVLKEHRVSAVLLAGHWSYYAQFGKLPPSPHARDGLSNLFDVYLDATLSATRDASIPVLLLGPGMEFSAPLPPTLVRQAQTHTPVGDALKVIPAAFEADTRLKRLALLYDNVRFVSVLDALCTKRDCPLTVDSETPMLWDVLHLTPEGSTYLIDRLRPQLDLFLQKLDRTPEPSTKPDAAPARVEASASPPR